MSFVTSDVCGRSGERSGLGASEADHLTGVRHLFANSCRVVITDLRLSKHDDPRERAVHTSFE